MCGYNTTTEPGELTKKRALFLIVLKAMKFSVNESVPGSCFLLHKLIVEKKSPGEGNVQHLYCYNKPTPEIPSLTHLWDQLTQALTALQGEPSPITVASGIMFPKVAFCRGPGAHSNFSNDKYDLIAQIYGNQIRSFSSNCTVTCLDVGY